MKFGIIILSVSVSLVAFCEKQPFERYQSIIDRQMFGPLPPGFDPTKSPSEVSASGSRAEQKELTQEQEKLQSSVHFSVINITPDGATAVGFTDNSDPKSPVHYYLRVGESSNGWLVKEADPVKATMTVVKGDVEVSLSIGDNSGKGAGTTSKAGAANSGGSRSGLLGNGRLGGSLRARRALREQQAQEAKAEEAAKAAKEAEERQAQAEAERAERDAERAQQRQQLLAIQEELRKAREARQKNESQEGDKSEDNDSF